MAFRYRFVVSFPHILQGNWSVEMPVTWNPRWCSDLKPTPMLLCCMTSGCQHRFATGPQFGHAEALGGAWWCLRGEERLVSTSGCASILSFWLQGRACEAVFLWLAMGRGRNRRGRCAAGVGCDVTCGRAVVERPDAGKILLHGHRFLKLLNAFLVVPSMLHPN